MKRGIILFFFGLFFFSMQFSLNNCSAFDLEEGRSFLFIRHGQTSWGPQDILKGPQDLNLNEKGKHQAAQAAAVVKEHKTIIDPIIYSSPLQRAYETATIFTIKCSLTNIIKIEGLKERYYGDYSKAHANVLSNYIPEDAESTPAFQKRVRDTLIAIFKSTLSDERELILVSHQKVFEFLTEWLSHKKLKLEQGGVCYFNYKNGVYSAEIYESSSSDSSD